MRYAEIKAPTGVLTLTYNRQSAAKPFNCGRFNDCKVVLALPVIDSLNYGETRRGELKHSPAII